MPSNRAADCDCADRFRNRRTLLGNTLLLMLVLCGLSPGLEAARDKSDANAPVQFEVPTIEGRFDSRDHLGDVILVDFWASWCPPCLKSFPWMNEMQARYGDQGFRVLAVSVDAEAGSRDDFLERQRSDFPIGIDPDGKLAEVFGLRGMPSAWLIGRDGRIVAEHVGFRAGKTAKYEQAIKDALAVSR